MKLLKLIKENYNISEMERAEKDHEWEYGMGVKFFGSKYDSKTLRLNEAQYDAIKKIIAKGKSL